MIRLSTAAFACALALSASASMAASQSSASISSLTFTLIDLNPRDGIAPSFNFLTSTGSTSLSVSAIDNALGESEGASRTRAGTFIFSKEYLAELTNASSQASIGSQSLSVSGSAAGPQTSYSSSASTGVPADPYNYYGQALNLSLSANSLLLIDANFDLSASASNASPCSYYSCDSDSSTASASLSLNYNFGIPGGSTSYNTVQSSSLQAVATGSIGYYAAVYNPDTGGYDIQYLTKPGVDENKNLSDLLSVVFTNSSSLTQSASLGLSVAVNGSASTVPEADVLALVAVGALVISGGAISSNISAVPESSSYAMGLAGLAMVGMMLRRRRQK